MRRLATLLVSAAVVGLTACAGSPDQGTSNTGPVQGPQLAAPDQVPNPSCAVTTADQIIAEINSLYIKNAWPDPNSALSKFSNVQNLLAAHNIDGARTATHDLVAFITNKFQHLTSAQQAATLGDYNKLVTDLYCYVGIAGTVFDLNPGDPEKAFWIQGVGGVYFPANDVPVGTYVALTNLTGLPCPLNTTLDCYPGFLGVSLYPNTVLFQAATVVLCPPTLPASTIGAVAHQDDLTGFEVLTPTGVPFLLSTICDPTVGQNRAPTSWLVRMLDRAMDALLPQKLQATPFRLVGGIGGLTTKFSPFGIVDLSLSATGGLGGSTTKFAPPTLSPNAAPTPAGAPPANPAVQGPAGTSATTALPFVTVQTHGGDNSVNNIQGATVTFSIGASVNYDPDSQAQLCRVVGGVAVAQDTVQVPTDANGVATLPCLIFGNLAGFANLAASFDASTLGFPNDNLVTITASDGSTSGNTLNWLVQSVAGQPTKLKFITTPSGTASAGVALTQQPTMRLYDALDNEVHTANISVTGSVSSGGGTIGGTTSVNTDADGIATFTDLSIGGKVAGVDQTLSFGFTGITTPLTAIVHMTAGPASQLEITAQPSSTANAGVAFAAQPAVTIEDQFGNTVNSTDAVVASLASGSSALAGIMSVNAVAGVATFTDLRIDGVAGPRTLSFASGGLTSGASNTITVAAGAATQLVITTQPSSTAQAGVPFGTQPAATLEDQFGNPVTTSSAAVTASLASGAVTLAGGLTVNAVAGVATFATLRIDGLVGSRTLRFTSGALTSSASNAIQVNAGVAATIQTYMGGVAAPTFTYPGTLLANTTVSPAPQAIVQDAFGNPVGSQLVFWHATTSNGGVLTVGAAGSPTSAAGTAQASAWLLGEGLNEATAGLSVTPSSSDALFSATTATGAAVFACAPPGSSKTDNMPFSIKTPNASVRTVTLWMSVNGQASSTSNYPATLQVYTGTNTAAAPIGSGSGVIQVNGDNGKALPITFVLTDVATQTESKVNSVMLFKLTITTPANRKPQLWYSNATFKSNDPCFNSLIYTSYPSLTVFKRGLSISVTN